MEVLNVDSLHPQTVLPSSRPVPAFAAGRLVAASAFPRVAAACLVVGLGGMWLFSLPVVVEYSARMLESEPALDERQWSDLAQQADVIVVLGGGRELADPGWGADQPSLLALERVRFAARLAKASGLPLLTSGGLHFGAPPSEAALMADVLARDYNVPVRWQEGVSRTTWENATHSADLLKRAGITRVVLVTQAWHMPRSRWSFEQAGLQVISAPMGFLGTPNGRPAGCWLLVAGKQGGLAERFAAK